jgi:hypothetical protein
VAKLILLGIVIYMTIVPATLAGRPGPRRTLKMIQWLTFVAVFVWALACRRCYPQLVPVE